MAWKRNVLVVANVTATSDELLSALQQCAHGGPASFTLIVPATSVGGGHTTAVTRVKEAVEHLVNAGLDAEGSVGHPDPIVAVTEAWDPRRYDEIVVSTLPMRFSKWLHAGLPERIERLTGAPVTHVVSQPPRPAAQASPAPARHEPSPMGPLSVLAWGAHKQS